MLRPAPGHLVRHGLHEGHDLCLIVVDLIRAGAWTDADRFRVDTRPPIPVGGREGEGSDAWRPVRCASCGAVNTDTVVRGRDVVLFWRSWCCCFGEVRRG